MIDAQVALSVAISGANTVTVLDTTDPEALASEFDRPLDATVSCDPILPIGTRRQVTRLAAKALKPDAEVLPLPAGAPYGAVVVDTEAARARNISVSNIPVYGTDSVAQYAMALLLELCHNIGHHDERVHDGGWAASGIGLFGIRP